MQWQTKLQDNNKFHRKYFFPFALCCNTRTNIFCFRKPTSKDSINCKYDFFEDKYICSHELSYWSGMRGAMWVSSSPFHKARKGGPAFHRPALLPLQIIYSHTTPKQTQSKVKHSDTLHTQYMWVNSADCLAIDHLTPEGTPHPTTLYNLIFSEKSNYPGHTRTLWQNWQLNINLGMPWALDHSQVPILLHLTQLLTKISPDYTAKHRI